MSDKITPAKLRKDGWKKDDADETTYWIDLDIRKRRTLFLNIANNGVHYSNKEWVYLRAVAGTKDLRNLVKCLRGY